MLLDNEWSSDFLNIKSWNRVAKLWCIAYEEYLFKTYKLTRKRVDALWLPLIPLRTRSNANPLPCSQWSGKMNPQQAHHRHMIGITLW